jgi:helicase
MGELERQGISQTILANLRRNVTDQTQSTARAKKAAVCLYYVSGMTMAEIENAVGQFGGAFGGSAGQIRSVTARTCDVLPMIARAAELLHPGVDLQERIGRLLLRLDLGIPALAVGLARYAGRDLDRADYRNLCDARLSERDALVVAEDAALLRLLGNDARKFRAIRDAVTRWRRARPAAPAAALPPYQQ